MSSSKKKQLRKEQYMTERQTAAAQEAKKLKRYTLTFWVVIALVLCVFVGAIVSTPIQNAVYKNTKAITVGDYTLSSVDVNYFYVDAVNSYVNEWSDYISYIMDVTKPLDEQISNKETGATWADDFLESAKSNITSTYALYDLAVKNGHKLSETEQQTVDSQITTSTFYALYYYGYDSLDSYLRAVYGAGAGEESYRKYLEVSALASSYLTAYSDSLEYSAEDLLDYQTDKSYEFNAYTYAVYELKVNSFLQGGTPSEDGKTTVYSDAEKAAAVEAAKAAADLLASGNYADLDAFDEAIKALPVNAENSSAASTNNEDLLYSKVGSLFRDWMIGKVEAEDEDAEPTFEERKEGDLTVIPYTTTSNDVETVQSYYVVRFGGVNDNAFAMKNVRHILFAFQGGTADSSGNKTYTLAEKQAAKDQADKALADWIAAGDLSEDSFAELSETLLAVEDTKEKAAEARLYEDVYPGQMVENFENWCYEEGRKPGDTGVVESPYGYHIMFFVSDSDTTYRDYMIENALRSDDVDAWYADAIEAIELTVLTTKHVPMDMVLSH